MKLRDGGIPINPGTNEPGATKYSTRTEISRQPTTVEPAGVEPVTFEQVGKLWRACRQWVERVKPSGPESFYQSDGVALELPDLAEVVCGIVGYAGEKGGSDATE